MDFRKNQIAQGSRGLRCNNPLNVNSLNWQGEVGHDGQEAIFNSAVMGIRAAAQVLYSYYFRHGWKTLYQITSNYAPVNDPLAHNEPLNYAKFLAQRLGIGVNDDIHLSYDNIRPLMRAMMQMEIGKKYADMVSDEDLQAGIDLGSEAEAVVFKGVNYSPKNV